MVKKGGFSVSGDKTPDARFVPFLEELLANFPERSRSILLMRFGIRGNKRETLEAIGRQYAITRERVRQVIDASLKHLKQILAERTNDATIDFLREKIAARHGIVPVDELLDELSGTTPSERGALAALLHGLPGVKFLKETKGRKESVALQDFPLTEWKKTVTIAEEILSEREDVLTLADLFRAAADRLSAEKISDGTPEKLAHYLSSSTSVGKNVFGYYGLSEWSAVRPRGTRERAHLILKTLSQPLHFREIARLIDEHGLARPGKKTHPQTVHNELIKDKRFVLVGRGTYALSVWGYKPGTVRQVLSEILKEGKKPMTKEELLQAVMKVRQVKKSTVIINLNTFFTKVGKNIYTLK